MTKGLPTAQTPVLRYRGSNACQTTDTVAREEPLEIRVNGFTSAYLMRLPGDDGALAAGYCLSEGLLSHRDELGVIELHHEEQAQLPGGSDRDVPDRVEVVIPGLKRAGDSRSPRLVRTGAGGLRPEQELAACGVTVDSETCFSPEVILASPGLLESGQAVFRKTGGTHGAGLFDVTGRMLAVREDVGRHNALDKVLGHLLLSGGTGVDKALILSGRLSYEMVLKAARAGIPLVCSVSAPTLLGVQIGVRTGVTVVGFLRGGSFNVYSHHWRAGGA